MGQRQGYGSASRGFVPSIEKHVVAILGRIEWMSLHEVQTP